MNVGQLNIPLQIRIQQTYSVGKFSKTLYEKDSDSKFDVKPKTRGGVFISISKEAKEFFTKSQQIAYQHSSPISGKNDTFKSVFEKINNDSINSKPGKKGKKKGSVTDGLDFEDYLNPEKFGYVISGNIFGSETEVVEKTPSEKLLEFFEPENNRPPGNLVNVLV